MQEKDDKLDVSVKVKDGIPIPPKDTAVEAASNVEVKASIPLVVGPISVGKEEGTPKKNAKKRPTTDANASINTGMPVDLEENVRLKRRKIKVAGAPKMPLNGYVRYMNDRRETLRKEYPDKSAIEHTRIIGEEWHQLPVEKKTPYMEAAEKDRQRYNAELHEFLKAHPDVWANEIAKSKAQKNANNELGNQQKEKALNTSKSKSAQSTLPSQSNNINNKGDEEKELQTVATSAQISNVLVERSVTPITTFPGNCNDSIMSTSNNNSNNNINININNNNSNNNINNNNICSNPFVQGEIPIFTNEFLEHNKILDNELRALRKSKTDLEQQNAVLEKHVDNMKCGVKKLTLENTEWKEKINMLENYFGKLKQILVSGLSRQQLPNDHTVVSFENIEKYMANLRAMSNSNIHDSSNFGVHDIIQKLDLQVSMEI